MNQLQIDIMFIYNYSARYIMYYPFYIFVLQGSWFSQRAYFLHSRTRSPMKENRIIVGWSHHMAFGLLRRSTGRTARFMDFIADQLVGLFGAYFYSALTSPLTSWLGCSVLDSSPTS